MPASILSIEGEYPELKSSFLLVTLLGLSLIAAEPARAGSEPIPAIPTEGQFTHGTLDSLLRQVVHEDLVDYTAIQQQRHRLVHYLGQIAGVRPGQLPTRTDSLAFFINAYNAITLGFVMEHYPGILSVLDVSNGNGGEGSPAFFKQKARVAGHYVSLDELEHKMLRGRLPDPRIHFAINCASVSCPPIRDRAYQAKGLEEQLDEVTVSFINDPDQNRFDPETGKLYLSQVFEWFPMDFERAAGSVEAFFFAYLEGYGPGRDVPETTISFLPYDWRLNARKP